MVDRTDDEAIVGRIAVVGIGHMGAEMARTLSRAGFDLVLWNRSRATVEVIANELGAEVADSPREAAAGASVIVSSLADDEAVRDVYLGIDGIAAGIDPSCVVLETSTINPEVTKEIGDKVGVGFVDAPVSGSTMLASQGKLTIMAGGDEASIARARPVLDALGAKVFHVGGRGAGATIKLAVNALVHGINGALSEALVLAEEAGVDRSTAYEVFLAGAAGAPFVAYKQAAFMAPESAPVAFSLDLVAKDLELITALAEEAGVDMPVARAGLGLTRDAIDAGHGDRDMSALAVYLRARAKGE